MKREEAQKIASILQGLLDAFSELSAEVNGKRAANWGKANKGLHDGETMLAKLQASIQAADEIEV